MIHIGCMTLATVCVQKAARAQRTLQKALLRTNGPHFRDVASLLTDEHNTALTRGPLNRQASAYRSFPL